MRSSRRLIALSLLGAVASCTEGVGPGTDVAEIPVAWSLQAPAAVSQAETAALGNAFDRVDAYAVVVTDSIDGTVILDASFDVVPAGPDTHTLRITLPQSTAGRSVHVAISGRDGGVELYRSSGHTRVQATTTPDPVAFELRYTGPGLRGTVIDTEGDPVGNVTVELFQGASPFAQVTTEPDGTYLFLPTSMGGVLTAGAYQVRPSPPGQFVCPAVRGINVTATSSVIANFISQTDPCHVELLVLSGGDVDDTQTVASIFAQTAGVTAQTFFYVNEAPTSDYLNQFDAVLLYANGQFNEAVTLGDQLAAYVQAGGNVVVASFYWQNRSDSNLGSPGWGALESMDPFRSLIDPTTGVGGATYQSAVLGQVTTGDGPTGDALVQGLNSLGSTGFRGGVQAVTGATVVARWSDGQPLVGYRILPGGQRMVAVSLFPGSGPAASGDTQALWENAVRWAGEAGGPGESGPAQAPLVQAIPATVVPLGNAQTSQRIATGATVRTFDDFTLANGGTITRVQWQGIYCVPTITPVAPAPTASSFTVAIHADANSAPDLGRQLASGTYTLGRIGETYLSTTTSGTCGTTTPTAIPLYAYNVTLNTPFAASAGTRYWLTVIADTPDFSTFWGWRSGTASNSRSLQVTQTGATNVFTTDRAFTLIGY